MPQKNIASTLSRHAAQPNTERTTNSVVLSMLSVACEHFWATICRSQRGTGGCAVHLDHADWLATEGPPTAAGPKSLGYGALR